jgi:hypothetical protein
MISRRTPVVRTVSLLVLTLTFGTAATARAQHMIELRGADTKYRFADWNYTSASGIVADVFYVGVPGSNELNVGGGYAITRGPVVVTPLVYGVIGKEGGQRGVKVALLATRSISRAAWAGGGNSARRPGSSGRPASGTSRSARS